MSSERVISLNQFGHASSFGRTLRPSDSQSVSGESTHSFYRSGKLRNTEKMKRKRTIWMFAMTWCIGCMVLLGVWNGVASADNQTTTVRVAAGDTLWKIAQQVDPHQDPRVVSNEILKLNQLSGSVSIYPGQWLKVPTD